VLLGQRRGRHGSVRPLWTRSILQRAQDDFFRESEESEEGLKSRRSEEVGEDNRSSGRRSEEVGESSLVRETSGEPVQKEADKSDDAGNADAHKNYDENNDLDGVSTTRNTDDPSGSMSTGTHSTNSIVRASTDTFDTEMKNSKQSTARESRRETSPIVRGATGGNIFSSSINGNGHQKSQSNSQRMWRRGAEITVKPAFGDAG
jgi:hypothetical protein